MRHFDFVSLGECFIDLAAPCVDLSLQWESQHAGLSCEQYQSWKRENDPEYQRQGLAGYLRDNGISKQLHTHWLTHPKKLSCNGNPYKTVIYNLLQY